MSLPRLLSMIQLLTRKEVSKMEIILKPGEIPRNPLYGKPTYKTRKPKKIHFTKEDREEIAQMTVPAGMKEELPTV